MSGVLAGPWAAIRAKNATVQLDKLWPRELFPAGKQLEAELAARLNREKGEQL